MTSPCWRSDLIRLTAEHGRCVLVTVVEAKGSAPRDAGTQMLVFDGGFEGTIGGGNLEYQALHQAGALLDAGTGHVLQRYPLGPLLGQCCGGHVTLFLQTFDTASATSLADLDAADWLHTDLETGAFKAMSGAAGAALTEGMDRAPLYALKSKPSGTLATMVQPLSAHLSTIYVFGAGHVGQALLPALAPLPLKLAWCDSREDMFPATPAAGVEIRCTNDLTALIDEAPRGAGYIIMTHDHELDYRLTERAMRREDAPYIGLIGSKTKRVRFERRLTREAGFSEAALGRLICPIGLPAIRGKEPAIIAASVAAQLLGVLSPSATYRQAHGERGLDRPAPPAPEDLS